MTRDTHMMWRNSLNMATESLSAGGFRKELGWLQERFGHDPDEIAAIYTGLVTEWFVESAGLFAVLHLPARQAPAALDEIRETLAHLDLGKELAHLEEQERHYYERLTLLAETFVASVGDAMASLLNCYVSGDYDPEANPNDLIAQALESAEEDLDRAQRLVMQAGAIALHSHPLWWRWQDEADGPVGGLVIAIANLVADYTFQGRHPLGPLEQARADAEDYLRKAKQELADKEGTVEPPTPRPSLVDNLIEALVQQGEEHFTPEQLAACRACREDAIPALIELATDEYLQLADAPGGGYAPINAVQLLGELRAGEAAPALIDIVADSDSLDIIHSAAVFALEAIGPPALEPLLDFLRYSWDAETKVNLAGAVTRAGPDDERVYEALVAGWEQATWEDGKCLLAAELAQVGGERAIPLLETALSDPALDDALDYNEVAAALEELGVEVPPAPGDWTSPDSDIDVNAVLEDIAYTPLGEINDVEVMAGFLREAPEEWRSDPETLAYLYADIQRDRLNGLIIMQAITLPPASSLILTTTMRQAVEALTFDGAVHGHARWLRETCMRLAESAGPELQRSLVGMLLPLEFYLREDYEIADDPDQLLAAARELTDEAEQRQLFGRAGALALHGRPIWPRWPTETDPPLSDWLEGLIEFRNLLERIGQIPVRPMSETASAELSAAVMEGLRSMREVDEPPPPVAELLDQLLDQNEDTIPKAQRRRFAHRRATVVPYLIQIIEDDRYWYEDGPGGGWAPILATRLLGELRSSQAADALVNAVAYSDPDDLIHDAALFSLATIGPPALPAVQAYLKYGRDIPTKISLAEVLGQIGRRNRDSFGLLRRVWEAAGWIQNRRMVALAFGDLRDRRAMPLLQAALKDREADALDLDYVHYGLWQLGVPTPLPTPHSTKLRTPAPYNTRLIFDDHHTPLRVKYTPWSEPLCPDCGQVLVLDESGQWTHPPELPERRTARRRKKRRKRHR
jgi:HEAT repeat protein